MHICNKGATSPTEGPTCLKAIHYVLPLLGSAHRADAAALGRAAPYVTGRRSSGLLKEVYCGLCSVYLEHPDPPELHTQSAARRQKGPDLTIYFEAQQRARMLFSIQGLREGKKHLPLLQTSCQLPQRNPEAYI